MTFYGGRYIYGGGLGVTGGMGRSLFLSTGRDHGINIIPGFAFMNYNCRWFISGLDGTTCELAGYSLLYMASTWSL